MWINILAAIVAYLVILLVSIAVTLGVFWILGSIVMWDFVSLDLSEWEKFPRLMLAVISLVVSILWWWED